MIFGVGIDLIEVHRVEHSLNTPGFREKVFGPDEIALCENRARKYESYAARFAAKEAFFKALGTGWRDGMAFSEVQILDDHLGKPELHLSGVCKTTMDHLGIASAYVSLSHLKETASAVVILERAR